MNKFELPEKMSALVLQGKQSLSLETWNVPSPAVGEVLVEVASVGVCGSDKHFYMEGHCGSEYVESPLVLGHEFGGRIVDVGAGVSDKRIGQRVSIEPLMPCGTCRCCVEGNYNICPNQRFFGTPGVDGGLQQYLSVPNANAHAISDAISDDASAMIETISVAMSGTRKAGISLGSRVLITGAGPVGLFVLQLAFLEGATEVDVVEPNDSRRTLAKKLGARVFDDLKAVDNARYDALIECTGVDVVRHDGLTKVLSGGRAVFVGVGSESPGVPMSSVIEREVSIQGVMRYKFTWPPIIAAIEAGRIEIDALVSRVLPLEDAADAWLKPFDNEIKTIIAVNGLTAR